MGFVCLSLTYYFENVPQTDHIKEHYVYFQQKCLNKQQGYKNKAPCSFACCSFIVKKKPHKPPPKQKASELLKI